MSDCMTFPETLDEFLEQYQFKDSEEIYTNGSMLIPVFRVKQWAEHIPAVDAVEVVRCGQCMFGDWFVRRGGGKYCYCLKTGARMFDESDFCSYGRREDGDA